MPYFFIEDFQAGLDVRKSPLTAPAGTLRACINAHITRGGEIERRSAFVKVGDFDPGTFGLHSVQDRLFTFGPDPDMARPSFVDFQQLDAPNGSPIKAMLSTTNFDGKVYAVAEYEDANILHWYDGQLVQDWLDFGEETGSLNSVARRLAQKVEDRANLQAVADGDSIIITANETGADGGFTVSVAGLPQAEQDRFTITVLQPPDAGEFQVTQVDISGTFLPDAIYRFEVNSAMVAVLGRASATGIQVLTMENRVFSVDQSLLRFSGFPGVDPSAADFDINEAVSGPDPTIWEPIDTSGNRTFAGAINLSTQDGGSEQLTGLAVYQDALAIFSDQTTHIWNVSSVNPIQMGQVQILPNLGTSAPRSVQTFGEADVFFLGQSGIRSLRARDSSNFASVADVGTPIDEEIQDFLAERGELVRKNAVSAIEPREGRYWLAVENRIYVLSRFPGSRITAWSRYEAPDTVTDIAVTARRIYIRAGDSLYLYGGGSGDDRDSAPADIVTPFSSADDPARLKQFLSFDVACEGKWDVYLRPDPTLPEYEELVAEIDGTTLGLQPTMAAMAQSTHVAFRLVSVGSGYHRLGAIMYHYQRGSAE